jgi:hypothetical protein
VEASFIVIRGDTGERVGSDDSRYLPQTGDVLIMRHPDDYGPTFRVVRREFINGETYVVVDEIEQHASSAARYAARGE